MAAELAQELVEKIKLAAARADKPVPVGLSNRHLHVSQADCEILFGKGSRLSSKRQLRQPGFYACNETVTLEGPKTALKNVRIIGPFRSQTQVEVSVSDAVALGLNPPVRDSGKLENSPGIKVTGPAGSVVLTGGVIVSKRHIHFTPAQARDFSVKDGEEVRVRCGCPGERSLVFEKVLCRVSDKFELELHLDIEEANAALVKNGDLAYIV
jgi:putative phosphotransacetylase